MKWKTTKPPQKIGAEILVLTTDNQKRVLKNHGPAKDHCGAGVRIPSGETLWANDQIAVRESSIVGWAEIPGGFE